MKMTLVILSSKRKMIAFFPILHLFTFNLVPSLFVLMIQWDGLDRLWFHYRILPFGLFILITYHRRAVFCPSTCLRLLGHCTPEQDKWPRLLLIRKKVLGQTKVNKGNSIELDPEMLEIASICLSDLDIDQSLQLRNITIQRYVSQTICHKEPVFFNPSYRSILVWNEINMNYS